MTIKLSIRNFIVAFALLGSITAQAQEKETLTPLSDTTAPQNFAEMWAGFDPRAEPLEIETVKEWEEDGAVLRIIRFRIGVFKGQKSKLAAVYGYPKDAVSGGKKLPGLLQIHGGGQYADHKACIANAKRGYATISIAWAGRISATDYRVDPNAVKLFWDNKTDDPNYKLTTDWGALDGYHAPSKNPKSIFPGLKPGEWTIDPVDSPRNSPWFICALAARRALTFLERQPEVDVDRIGVYGHSMGGKLTVMTSVDPRVKAAAPSCGGISDRDNDSELFRATIGDGVSLKQISCPIVFLSPSNDFHGRIGDLPTATQEIASEEWRVTCSPHLNHKDDPEFEVATLLWFDQHLKGTFEFPQTPETSFMPETSGGSPVLSIKPDPKRPYSSVDIYYTQQGKATETRFDRENTMNRFWRHAAVKKNGKLLTAKIPAVNPDKPLWVYANVTYPLDEPVSGAGYYYGAYTANSFNVSSMLIKVTPAQLKAGGAKPTATKKTLIENFKDGWEKEWYVIKSNDWPRATHKVYDETYHAPAGAKLSLQVKSKEKNVLCVTIDGHVAVVEIEGGDQWQTIKLLPNDIKNYEDSPLPSWNGIKELKLSFAEHLRPKRGSKEKPRLVGKGWKGQPPEFRDLKWE